MALALHFVPNKFPRTITRREWKEIWRWKRLAQKQLAEETEKRMLNFILYGTSHPELLDDLINPPLLVHDKQELG